MSYCFRLYDVVRIDHFRGFDEYFSIPYGDKDAKMCIRDRCCNRSVIFLAKFSQFLDTASLLIVRSM